MQSSHTAGTPPNHGSRFMFEQSVAQPMVGLACALECETGAPPANVMSISVIEIHRHCVRLISGVCMPCWQFANATTILCVYSLAGPCQGIHIVI